MKRQTFHIKLNFTEPLLGSASNNKEVHAQYIASKAPSPELAKAEVDAIPEPEQTEEEIAAAVKAEVQKSMTVFPRDSDGFVHLWDYQARGFFKEALGVLIELGESTISKWQYKKAIDSLLFVQPRRIYLLDQSGKKIRETGSLQRPLRADTMQGERIALANSEILPEGTQVAFDVFILIGDNPNRKSKIALITDKLVIAALDYGALKGFGQWRSGGYGRFTYEVKTDPAK